MINPSDYNAAYIPKAVPNIFCSTTKGTQGLNTAE